MTARSEQPPRTTYELRSVPIDVYRYPNDGRKWRLLCSQRRTLALQMASHGDPDGSNIWAAVGTWVKDIGIQKRVIERRLAELVGLKFVRNEGWKKVGQYKSTRVRSLDLEEIFAAHERWKAEQLASDSPSVLPSDSKVDTECQLLTPAASVRFEGVLASDSHVLASDRRLHNLPSDLPLTSQDQKLVATKNFAPALSEQIRFMEDPLQDQNLPGEVFETVFEGCVGGASKPSALAISKPSPNIQERCKECQGTGFVYLEPDSDNIERRVRECQCRRRRV